MGKCGLQRFLRPQSAAQLLAVGVLLALTLPVMAEDKAGVYMPRLVPQGVEESKESSSPLTPLEDILNNTFTQQPDNQMYPAEESIDLKGPSVPSTSDSLVSATEDSVSNGTESAKKKFLIWPSRKKHFKTVSLEAKAIKTPKKPKEIVYYTPLSAMAIVPVIKGGNKNSFYDLPLLFSKELAILIEQKAPNTRVINHAELENRLKEKNLGYLYDQLVDYYLKSGQPDPVKTQYFLHALTNGDESIARLMFVETDLDLSNPMDPKGLGGIKERIVFKLNEQRTDKMKYHVNARMQIFDSENPKMPRVWAYHWHQSVRADKFNNMSPSVFTDADSMEVFGNACRLMGREIMVLIPKAVYQQEHIQTGVEGQLVSQDQTQPASLTTEDKQAINRVLSRP